MGAFCAGEAGPGLIVSLVQRASGIRFCNRLSTFGSVVTCLMKSGSSWLLSSMDCQGKPRSWSVGVSVGAPTESGV